MALPVLHTGPRNMFSTHMYLGKVDHLQWIVVDGCDRTVLKIAYNEDDEMVVALSTANLDKYSKADK